MAEEGTFFKYPRIAWGPTDDNKCAEEKVHHKYNPTKVHSRYLPESPPIISTNYAGPSKAKLLLQSSFSKFHLAPRLTYSPAEQSRFLHRRQPSRYTPHPLTAAAKARCLTGQPLHYKSLSWISKERRVVPFLTAERKRAANKSAQIVPANSISSTSAMDSNREDTMQEPAEKKLHPRKPCQCSSSTDTSCIYHSDVTEESIDQASVCTPPNLINVLPANTSEATNITEVTVTAGVQSHPEQSHQSILDEESDHDKVRNTSIKKMRASMKLLNISPTGNASDATITSFDAEKEKSESKPPKPPVGFKPRLSHVREYNYTPAANASCDVYHIPIVYSDKYNIDITKLYQWPKKKKVQSPPVQPFLLDKPVQVFSAVKDKLLYHPIEAIDASLSYNLFNFVSDPIRRCRVDNIVELMNLAPLKLPKPITWKKFSDCMLHPLLVQMMGSVLTCKLAIDEGWAINVGGGFSHYTTNIGGGLCVYDDVLVCLAMVSEFPNVKHILVINLDAYQSPCYKYVTAVLCKVTIIDFYSQPIEENHGYSTVVNKDIKYMGYMVSKEEETSSEYLSHFKQVVKEYLETTNTQPSLCIYVAGTTILAENRNTVMKFSNEGVVKRDHTMFQLMKHFNIPIAYLMGGGYQPYDVRATSSSIISLLENNILIKRLGGKEF